ncbi:ABC-F family ATP-binding cassette domain-containing protein [Pseudomonas frederiksbergensis]|uniref:ABC transporter n=1 Tax=Pseudomonas frederiksbergensis TaxID=104087 RepID=A0A423HRA7_9PSED|nr:ABC-F family ATP-binding cassette domain-containing protein [Pseudomonas frederiksbergensis]RON15722.1 ABC transporter [Pseudomonas frederiksbergensis]
MSESLIHTSQLCFAWPNGQIVFDQLSCVFGPLRTGLVAPNGAGKSTLLRLLAGHIEPMAGQIAVQGTLAYLPQHLPLTLDMSVAQLLGIAVKLEALAAILSGNAEQALFDLVGDDWDIEEKTRAGLARLGLGDVPFDRKLNEFSGGEIMSLGLAAQLLGQPDILLLDEPSNNLDHQARQRLYQVLDTWSGCLVVASHDRELLERMDQVAELNRTELRLYGGGFNFYQQVVRAQQQAAQQNVNSLRKEVKRDQRQMQLARERAERRASNASRNLASAGLPKIVAGNLKRGAQVSAAKSNEAHGAKVDRTQARLAEAKHALREELCSDLSLPATQVPQGLIVFSGKSMQVLRDERPLFGSSGVDLDIRGPERIGLSGANGVGKSTLLQVIGGISHFTAETICRGSGRVAYLSQRLDLLDAEASAVENFARFAPTLPAIERANRLARMLLRGEQMQLPVGLLSGGERLRAILACLLHAEPAPQLLLLDEPTNSLDLDAVGQLEMALSAYRGALVVVSHDERFLKALNLTRRLSLVEGKLEECRHADC